VLVPKWGFRNLHKFIDVVQTCHVSVIKILVFEHITGYNWNRIGDVPAGSCAKVEFSGRPGITELSKIDCTLEIASPSRLSVESTHSQVYFRAGQFNGVVQTCPRLTYVITVIDTTVFMELSLWHSHCQSSPDSFDECRTAPNGRRPLDQALNR